VAIGELRLGRLGQCQGDIQILASFFLERAAVTQQRPLRGFSSEAMAALCAYPWPGNVRELQNVIEAAFTFGRSDTIRLSQLPREISRESMAPPPLMPGLLPTFADAERDLVQRALDSTSGNKVQAARLLRISRKKLYAKIAKYGLRE